MAERANPKPDTTTQPSPAEPITILVLGPMQQIEGDEVTAESITLELRDLVRQIVKDLATNGSLADSDVEVIAPEDARAQVIADGVLEMMEMADLVILDLTGQRANVTYEAAIVHALGLPHIMVTGDARPPFYFQSVQCIANFTHTATFDGDRASHRRLQERIACFLTGAKEAADLADNILTRHFDNLPIADISGPSGLAAAFYKNSLRRFLRRDGYIEASRTFSWAPVEGQRQEEQMRAGGFIAVKPTDFHRDGRNIHRELIDELAGLGYQLVDVSIAAKDSEDIRDFGGKVLARLTPKGAPVRPLNPAIIVDSTSILDALPQSPRIRRFKDHEQSGRHHRGFKKLKSRLLHAMTESFWKNVAYQADTDEKAAWFEEYVAFCPVGSLAETLRRFVPPQP